ncbi:MAG: HEPN domain-containing protein [Nitrospiraceae bacterium]
MRCIEVVQGRHRLDNLFKQIAVFSQDLELQAHWARYLCVLVSGFMEFSVRAIYTDYVGQRATPDVVNYVERKLSEFQNPKMDKILDLVQSFNSEWGEELKRNTEGELKDAVDSIVANKNRIAHGEDVGITYSRINHYYKNALRVVDLIEDQCNVS